MALSLEHGESQYLSVGLASDMNTLYSDFLEVPDREWLFMAAYTTFYRTSNSRCMGVSGEALQLHAVYKRPYF